MKRVNFHTVENLTTPDRWLEQALCVPERKRTAPRRYSRAVTAAASLLLVSALSLAVWLLWSDRPNAPVIRPNDPTATVFSEESTVPGVSEAPTAPEAVLSETSSAVLLTEQPTEAATDRNEAEVAEPATVPDTPTQTVTELSSEMASQAPSITTTEAATQTATELAAETEEPTEAPVQHPTQAPTVRIITVNAWLEPSKIPADGRVYCRIVTDSGELLGDWGLYDDERLTKETVRTEAYTIFTYNYREHLTFTGSINGTGYVYDGDGNVLYTCSGTFVSFR